MVAGGAEYLCRGQGGALDAENIAGPGKGRIPTNVEMGAFQAIRGASRSFFHAVDGSTALASLSTVRLVWFLRWTRGAPHPILSTMNFVTSLGHHTIDRFHEAVYALGFFGRVLTETFLFVRRKQVGFKVLVMQILFTGVEALSISAILAMGIGAVVNIVGLSLLPQFGQGRLMYVILIAIITRYPNAMALTWGRRWPSRR
jgi:hypothetical protein